MKALASVDRRLQMQRRQQQIMIVWSRTGRSRCLRKNSSWLSSQLAPASVQLNVEPLHQPHLARLHLRPSSSPAIISARFFSASPASKELTPTSSDVPATRDSDETTAVAAYRPIDFKASAKIEGEESQVAIVQLNPGECLRAESGAMLFMTPSIDMNTHLAGASSAFRRMLTGQNVFLTDFTCNDQPGTVGLGTDFPSKIIRLSLSDLPNHSLICQRGAFLASNPTVDIQMEFTKSLKAGFFGGQGFVLQKLTTTDASHDNDVLIKAGGTLVTKDLADGESIRVTSGSIVAFESTIDYDVQMMPGIKNVMFGGEGLFVTRLTGPGRVWLQGMPADRMIAEIARRVPAGMGLGVPIGMGGGGSTGADGAEGDKAGGAGADGPETSEDMVAASDAAIDADRQATVATSGMMDSSSSDRDIDADSPSALFGDAAPDNAAAGKSTPSDSDDSMFGSTSTSSSEPTFGDDASFSSSSSEPSFDDTSFSSSSDDSSLGKDISDGELFDDTTTSGFGEGDVGGAAEQVQETGSSIFSMLWDLFTGGSDD